MKMVKNIAIVACAASFMFANVSFHMGNNYSGLDAAEPTVATCIRLPSLILTNWWVRSSGSVKFGIRLRLLFVMLILTTNRHE